MRSVFLRRCLFVHALAGSLSFARASLAADDLEPPPTLDEDDVAEELAFIDPFDHRTGSLSVTLSGALARANTVVGTATRWEFGVLLHVPLDRFFLGGARLSVSPSATSRPSTVDVGAWGTGGTMSSKSRRRWGALAALPGALAIGGVASAQSKAPKSATSSASSSSSSSSSSVSNAPSTSPSIVAPSAPSVAGVIVVVEPAVLAPTALRTLVNAAWHQTGLDRDETLDEMASRARMSALAPEVRLRAHRTLAVGARVFSSDTLSDHTTLSDGTQTFLEARLTWRLDRWVFADEEVAIERLKLDRAELRQRVSARVIDLALSWQRARRASANVDLLPQEREEAAAVAIESLLALDAYTGGQASLLLK